MKSIKYIELGSFDNTNKCEHCGNNPVPHFVNWYFESVDVFLAPLRRFLIHNPFSRLLKKLGKIFNLPLKLVNLGFFFHAVSFQEDILKCKVRRAQVLWEEASKRGIEMKELLLFGRPFDCYLAEKSEIRPVLRSFNEGGNPKSDLSSEVSTKGGKNLKSKILSLKSKMVFSGLPRPSNYDNKVLDWMDDKRILKKYFIKAGLPAPKGGSCWNFRQAKRIFESISKPVVVKPRAGSRGRHSTTFVNNLEDLKQAFLIAKKLCFWVIVEEQLLGPVYRATLINFELCGVLRGDPPQVIGDGAHNIGELIKIKNSQPHPGVHPVKSSERGIASQSFDRVKEIIIDEGMERFMQRTLNSKFIRLRQGFVGQENQNSEYPPLNSPPILGGDRGGKANSYLNYIPASGEIIQLSEKIGVNYGGSSSEDFEICHTDNKELFIRAAKILGDPIVGFDFIIPNIAKSWKEQKCGFIEANSLPFINLHHDPLLGAPRNIAAAVWNMINW